jgi:hypothetical protein
MYFAQRFRYWEGEREGGRECERERESERRDELECMLFKLLICS